MGTTRDDGSQQSMWVATTDLPRNAGHPFYERLNRILSAAGFDAFVEGLCARFYTTMGRPGLAPGRYFRLLLLGYFEGLDSERAIAWRAADSLSLRAFLHLAPPAAPPDHSTISRTRRLFPVETHQVVFTWVLQQLAEAGLVQGKTVGIDATTLEANAAMRSIVRRDTGEDYTAFLTRLAKVSGIETPTAADLARFDWKRKKKTSNKEWTHPHDPDAKVAKMKDGRTHMAHKAEHAVDLETGAVVGVTPGRGHGGYDDDGRDRDRGGRAGRGGVADRAWDGGGGGGQGLPQQRDDGGLGRGGCPQLYRGAGPGRVVILRWGCQHAGVDGAAAPGRLFGVLGRATRRLRRAGVQLVAGPDDPAAAAMSSAAEASSEGGRCTSVSTRRCARALRTRPRREQVRKGLRRPVRSSSQSSSSLLGVSGSWSPTCIAGICGRSPARRRAGAASRRTGERRTATTGGRRSGFRRCRE